MKLLNGSELAGFITERQAKQVRALRQAWGVFPKLVIVSTTDDAGSAKYMELKRQYGEDILIDVDVRCVEQSDVKALIEELNNDETVHGIIVQLPLADPSETDTVVNAISPEKDVDGLGSGAKYLSATATAIDWLLAGYNIALQGKDIVIIGEGRLVGAPLASLWRRNGLEVRTLNDTVEDLAAAVRSADIIVSAAGSPRLVTLDMVAPGAVIVDAGVVSENGVLVGDVSPEVRTREDITITPERGGVGPLTVAALFDAVIQAAQATRQELA